MENKIEKRGRKAVESIYQKVEKYTDKGKKDYNFIFGYFVNQQVVIQNKWNIDVIDLGIFICIERFIQYMSKEEKSNNDLTVKDSLGTWYFISEYKILHDMPLLPLSSSNAVYKRITKLVNCGLIERNPNNVSSRLKLIRLGVNAKLLNQGLYNKNQ